MQCALQRRWLHKFSFTVPRQPLSRHCDKQLADWTTQLDYSKQLRAGRILPAKGSQAREQAPRH